MRLLLGCLLALAACGGDSGQGGDDGAPSDATSSVDGFPSSDAAAQTGLNVSWDDQPPIPGPFSSGVTITSVRLEIDRLEVVGDAGGPETTRLNYDAAWTATLSPFPISFPLAQPGLYSQVSMTIDGKTVVPSYEILGTVVNGGSTEPFKITDTAQLQVDISGYSVQLFPGNSEDLVIRIDMDEVIDASSPAMFPLVLGVRTMDQNTPGIAAVRTALQATTFIKGT